MQHQDEEVLQTVAAFVAQTAVARQAVRWAVAVSGGVDSMVLLHVLHRLRQVPLHALHVHHGVRKRADEDAELVQSVCAQWEIPVTVLHVQRSQVDPAASRGLEADLRTLRYQALADAAQAVGAAVVWLAHHADDQVETVLWRLLRGSSLTGLGGMRPIAARLGMTWLRPLLSLEKACLHAYASRHQVPFHEDESNADPTMTRNFLRHHIVPLLRQRQPNLCSAVGHTVAVLQAEDEYMEARARAWLRRCAGQSGERVWIDTRRLAKAPLALQRRAVHLLLTCLASADWEFCHVEAVRNLMSRSRPSSAVHLPGGWVAYREYQRVWLSPQAEEHMAPPVAVKWGLQDKVQWVWPPEASRENGWVFYCRSWQRTTCPWPTSLWHLLLPPVSSVVVRSCQKGERVAPLGMKGSKKVQDVMVDAKVPRRWRAFWPAVEVAGRLVWLPGLVRSRWETVPKHEHTGWWLEVQPPAVYTRTQPGAMVMHPEDGWG
ncbi:MAG: tRNA lysidine(34) synthetase TilS, partial [Alicyclobacillus sp.]|nr:tRNA lysidine(34) synthetase TilS [Alicyclobacillus sp.]